MDNNLDSFLCEHSASSRYMHHWTYSTIHRSPIYPHCCLHLHQLPSVCLDSEKHAGFRWVTSQGEDLVLHHFDERSLLGDFHSHFYSEIRSIVYCWSNLPACHALDIMAFHYQYSISLGDQKQGLLAPQRSDRSPTSGSRRLDLLCVSEVDERVSPLLDRFVRCKHCRAGTWKNLCGGGQLPRLHGRRPSLALHQHGRRRICNSSLGLHHPPSPHARTGLLQRPS